MGNKALLDEQYKYLYYQSVFLSIAKTDTIESQNEQKSHQKPDCQDETQEKAVISKNMILYLLISL